MQPSTSPSGSIPVYFEDLQVGQKIHTRSYRISLEEIQEFARQFDPQPFHVDPQAAQESFFGQMVASGWHTASITMRLMVESGFPIAGGLIGMGADISWPRPTLPGSVLQVECEVIELRLMRSRNDRGLAVIRNETKTQAGEVVQTLVAKMIIPRRGFAPDDA